MSLLKAFFGRLFGCSAAGLVVLVSIAATAEADDGYVFRYNVTSWGYTSAAHTLVQCKSAETLPSCQSRALLQVSSLYASSWFPPEVSAVSLTRFAEAPVELQNFYRDRVYTFTDTGGVSKTLLATQVSSTAKSNKMAVADSGEADSAGGSSAPSCVSCPAPPVPISSVPRSDIRGVDVPEPWQPSRISQAPPALTPR